jgi:hypothetical protein
VIEDYGYCSRTGVCWNPFGIKPAWVIKLANQVRKQYFLDQAEEATF